jgi:mycothiol S-conjugate amidase
MTHPLTLMIVHAHPDDECIGTGGVLARYSAAGVHTVLVTATGGEEGEIVVPELNTPENKERLREIRDAELTAAVAILGVGTLERLGYRDSGMVGTLANANNQCLHMADKLLATGRLVNLIRTHRPHVLISYDERGGYWHPDHLACHLITVAAFHAAGDPGRYPAAGAPWHPLKLYQIARPREELRAVWQELRERGLPSPLDNPDWDITRFTTDDARITTVIDVSAFIRHKREAIACHVTQISQQSPFLSMPEDLANKLFGVEHFIRTASRVTLPADPETDLFAGLH